MPFLLKNPIGSGLNYLKPETGTDKQAGGAGSKTVESDTVQQVDDLGTILVTTFFNVLHDYNKILCFISFYKARDRLPRYDQALYIYLFPKQGNLITVRHLAAATLTLYSVTSTSGFQDGRLKGINISFRAI